MKFLTCGRGVVAWVCRLLSWVAAALLAASVVITAINVFLRYVLSAPWDWADEAMTLLLVGMVFLVLPWVELRGDHLRVTLFEARAPARVRTILGWVRWGLTVAVTGCLTVVGLEVSLNNYRLSTTTPALGLPLWLPYALVPVGACLSGLARLVNGLGAGDGAAAGTRNGKGAAES